MLASLAVCGAAAIALLVAWRWLDRREPAPAGAPFSRARCSHCGSDAECYRPRMVEVRSTLGTALDWALPLAVVPSRFRVVDATWEGLALCRLHAAIARSAIDAALAREALTLAEFLEGRASRLCSFEQAVLGRMLRRSAPVADARDLAS